MSNNAGTNDFGITFLLQSRQVRKMISTYVAENKVFEKMFLAGQIEVELNPQGTFAERIRDATLTATAETYRGLLLRGPHTVVEQLADLTTEKGGP